MLDEVKIAIDSYRQAWGLLNKHRLWPLVIVCGLIYLILLSLIVFGIYSGTHSLVGWAQDWSWVKWLTAKFSFFKWILQFFIYGLAILAFLVTLSFYKYILLILASPIYAYISERTEEVLNNKNFPFSLKALMEDIVRGVRISLRNLYRQSFFTVLLLLLSLIPVVGIIATGIIFIIDCYYYGFSMLDYSCERKRMSVRDSVSLIYAHRGIAIGIGLIFYLLLLIPIVGFIIGPPLSVIAATIALHKKSVL